ncbi:PAS domain-containing sensor histidine kinase [Marivirga tractuosa]|uniref:PAS domain S-box protein n=1 Tax=Marivirga tractuosa TaxID=1006 RepID=UPI0035D11E50
MENLKQLLYNCITTNESFFQLVNEYAVEGYCFWEKENKNKILLDAKMASRFGHKRSIEIEIQDLEKLDYDFFDSILKEVENNLPEDKLNSCVLEVSINKPLNTTKARFISFHNENNNHNYILFAIESTTNFHHEKSIDEISDILDIAIWQWNLQTNELKVNEKWANILGYTLSELQPISIKTYEDLTHPDDVEYSMKLINNYIAGDAESYSCEVRMLHKNGYWKWVLGKGKIVSRTVNGEVEWITGSHIDITERKIHENEMDTLALVPLYTLYGVIIADSNGEIIFVNHSFEKMSGYKQQEVLGKRPGDILQGEKTDLNDIKSFSKNLATGKSFTQEIVNHKKTGEAYRVSCYIDPIYNESGELIKYISIQTDITEKKQNQEYLATFKNTLDQTEDCVFIFNQSTLQFSYVNHGAIEMMGYSEEELLQLHPYDIKPEFPEKIFRNFVAPLINQEKLSHRFRTLHRTKNGVDMPVEVFLQFIHNENVNPHFVAIVKDITDQLAIEEKLKRLSLVAEKTTNLVVITDDKGRIEYVNPAFESKTGYLLDEVLGGKPGKFLHGKETNPKHIKANRAGLKALNPFTQEILNYSKFGEKYWVSITFNPVFNENGKLTNFIAIESDITERKHRENLLKESEERLQFVLKGSELGYWDWEADSGEMTVNDRWYEMLGYTRKDFKPTIENWHALVHPEDMRKLNDIMENVFPDKSKSEFYVELRAKHKKGHYIWILDRGAVVERNEFGEPSRISGMHMEISKRKKLEIELEEERNFLNKVINANALSLIVINKSGKIKFANRGAEYILGLRKNKIEEKVYDDPQWHHITLDDEVYPLEDLPFSIVMRSKKPIQDIQHGIIWEDGTKKYISVTGGPFSYTNEGIEDIIFSVTNITERVKIQKQLDETKNQMQSILKEMDDVVWSVAMPDFKMIYITPSIEKVTGLPQSFYLDEPIEDTWDNRIYHHDKQLLEKAYMDLNEKGSFEAEYRICTKNGALKWVLIKGKIINENGVPSRLDGYISDITDKKNQENSLKKYLEIVEDQNDRLKNFTYIVSHNLRSHSANIQGLMYLINKKHPEIAEIEYIKMLNKASNKLDDTLHHLNNVVSVVSSSEEMQKINLSDSISAFYETFENLISESKIWFLNEVSKNVIVEAVPAFLESILTNLLTNAIKYRDPEKKDPYVRISSRNFNGIVIIEIEDNGLGIDLDKHGDKLFGMYKTFHGHKDSRGLGLFLTKNQVESMGGKIEVASELGVGSNFKVLLKDGNI